MKKCYILFSAVFLILTFFSCSSEEENDGTGKTDKVFVIDNAKFGISNNKSNARETTDGINKAIEQAKDQGYTSVKLTKGDYLIRCTGATGYETGNGIFMPNNITLDLTDTRLYTEANNTISKIFRIDEVENIIIFGGHLIGDKDNPESGSNSGSCGIEINCSRNITIRDMIIEKFTGSAIHVGYGFIAPNERRLNKDIKILNCDISDSYMQGITIIHARGMEIANCKIYNIGGREPGCGIDIEPESDWGGSYPWKSWVEDVKIHHNEFKDTKGEGLCFVNPYTTDIEAADNTFENSAIVINRDPKRIRLVRNKLSGWESYMVALTCEDVYMPLEGDNMNIIEFPQRVTNCSKLTGYIKETNNYLKCD